MNELESWLILARAPRIGPVSAKSIVSHFGTVANVIDASHADRKQSGLFSTAALVYFKDQLFSHLDADLAVLSEDNVHGLHWGHEDYPFLLSEIDDPPLVLFVRGDVALLSMPQVGIVGSRSADRSGNEMAYEFARTLSQGGVTVTSGMAMGIDAAAHKGALTGASGTIAVMGTGLDRIYPAKNKSLAYEIAEQGTLVTEFGAGMGPRAENFPRRNRIISGLSLGILVVQAALRSGSLITARTAMEQGREVFAVPGSINNPVAKGCHHIIKEGAKLVETAQDIMDELSGMLAYKQFHPDEVKEPKKNIVNQSDLLAYLTYDPMLIDELPQITTWPMAKISAELLVLELDGLVEMLAGAKVQRV